MHVIDGPNSDFASRLFNARRRMNLTQEQVAKYCDIATRNISLYESGNSMPRSNTLQKLAECLEMDTYYLVHGRHKNTDEYCAKSSKQFHERIQKKLQYLYINEWNSLSLRKHITFNQMQYSENPTKRNHSSDLSLFIPYVAPIFDFVAVKIPNKINLFNSIVNQNYEQILIIDYSRVLKEDFHDGMYVLYAPIDKSLMPSLGVVRKEIGESNLFIQSIPNGFKVFELDENEYEILGMVDAVISRKS